MKQITLAGLLFGVTTALVGAQVPRPAPELRVNVPEAAPVQLSHYRGKVVVLEFLYTTCVHCQNASRVMSRLQTQYGAKGFQALGVAFNDMAHMLVPDFVRDFQVNYPVGYSDRETVQTFLQNDPRHLLAVPQIVIIDRKGVIRYQSLPRDDHGSASEPFLRDMIGKMLKESSKTITAKPKVVKKPAA